MQVFISLLSLAAISAAPYDPVLRKLDPGLRHQYAMGSNDELRLVDLWVRASDVQETARYNPDSQNVYHLFTRANPTVSQPLLIGSNPLESTNFNPLRRTKVLLHGWLATATADFNTVLVPAFLNTEDVNVIVVDWFSGAGTTNYAAAVLNTATSAEIVARFIDWLNTATGSNPTQYHIVGHGLGGHKAGMVGRHLRGQVAYITALDPAFAGFVTNDDKFSSTDGVYTEVIHTNAGLLGYVGNLGQVDFYPNGGIDMPGCLSQECDHARSFHYLAESIQSGGFTGSRCASFITAMAGSCYLWGSLQMGGIAPKTGSMGIYHMRTNIFPPFSRG